MGRPRSLLLSSASVTVVIPAMLGTADFSSVATTVASGAWVGVGVGVGVADVEVAAGAAVVTVGWVEGAEQPARMIAATPRATRCLRIDPMIGA